MVKNIILKYPNENIIHALELGCYHIHSINKDFLIYATDEMIENDKMIYFGELKKVDDHFEMATTKKEDLEALRDFLILFATEKLEFGSEYSENYDMLNNHTIVVTGGGKTKINVNPLSKYLQKIETEKEEIEELDFSDLEETETETKETPVETAKVKPVEDKKETPVVVEKEKPKKKGLGVVITMLVLLLLAGLSVGAYFWIKENNRKADEEPKPTPPTTLTLEQIGTKLRATAFVTRMQEETGELPLITMTSSELNVKIKEGNEYQYTLQDKIIKATIAKDDTLGLELNQYVYACIQELLGNDKNEVLKAVQEFVNPTIEKEGIAWIEDEINYQMTLSLETKYDLETVEVTGPVPTSILEEKKENLLNEDRVTIQYGDLWFEKSAKEEETVITIIQKDTLTTDAYETFLNYLTVVFGEEEKDSFASDIPNFEEEKEEDEYIVTLNGTLDESLAFKYSKPTHAWVEIKIAES